MRLSASRFRWLPVLLLLGLLLSACGGALPSVGAASGGGGGPAAVVALTARTKFVGTVDAISAAAWTISGQPLLIDAATEIRDQIALGDLVSVEASVSVDGTVTALEIRLERSRGDDSQAAASAEEIEFFGTVEAIGDSSWTIQGVEFALTPSTEINGTLAVGDLVKVHALVAADGTFSAREIERADEAELAGGLARGEFVAAVEAITEAAWTIGGVTVLITADTEIKDTIAVGDLVEVHVVIAPDGTMTAREIELEHDDDPSLALPGEEIEFVGVVEAIAGEAWTIRGRTLTVGAQTEIDGMIEVGDFVKVEAIVGADGTLTALEIEAASTDASVSSDDDGDEADDESDDSDQDEDSDDDDGSDSDDGSVDQSGDGEDSDSDD